MGYAKKRYTYVNLKKALSNAYTVNGGISHGNRRDSVGLEKRNPDGKKVYLL